MAKKSHQSEQKKTKQKPKRHFIRKAIGLGLLGTATAVTTTAVGAWGAWQYAKAAATHRRRHTADFNNIVTANTYRGMVHKDSHSFTLTTATMTYHVLDPFAIVDKLAKDHAEQLKQNFNTDTQTISDYYDFEVTVLAELSQKGHYGYLGHLDYQLTIVGVPE